MQTGLNTKVSNESLYHPSLSWLGQQLQMSCSAQLRGTSLIHGLLSDPSCRVRGVLGSSSHPGSLCALFIAKPVQVIMPQTSEKCSPGDWVDHSPPPLSLLFLSLFQGTGQPLAHHPQTHARAAGPRGEMNHLQWEIMIAGFLS